MRYPSGKARLACPGGSVGAQHERVQEKCRFLGEMTTVEQLVHATCHLIEIERQYLWDDWFGERRATSARDDSFWTRGRVGNWPHMPLTAWQ